MICDKCKVEHVLKECPQDHDLLERSFHSSESALKRVEIVVLKYKAPLIEKRCIGKILSYTDWPYKLNVYDNRMNNGSMPLIWNKVIKDSNCDYVLVMDSDIYVKKGWLTKMMETFDHEDERLVSVVPLTNVAEPPHKAEQVEGDGYRLAKAPISGCCFLVHRKRFLAAGPFDLDFYIFGNDSEWSYRLIRQGWKIAVRKDVWVKHLSNASTAKASKSRTRKKEFDWDKEIQYAADVYAEKVRLLK